MTLPARTLFTLNLAAAAAIAVFFVCLPTGCGFRPESRPSSSPPGIDRPESSRCRTFPGPLFIFFGGVGSSRIACCLLRQVSEVRLVPCSLRHLRSTCFSLVFSKELERFPGKALRDRSEKEPDGTRYLSIPPSDQIALRVDEVEQLFFGEVGADAGCFCAEPAENVVVGWSVHAECLKENRI